MKFKCLKISSRAHADDINNVYSFDGRLISRSIRTNLPAGVYITGGRKVFSP